MRLMRLASESGLCQGLLHGVAEQLHDGASEDPVHAHSRCTAAVTLRQRRLKVASHGANKQQTQLEPANPARAQGQRHCAKPALSRLQLVRQKAPARRAELVGTERLSNYV